MARVAAIQAEPAWWDLKAGFQKNCLSEILAAAKEAGIWLVWVVLGFCEVDGGSTYASQAIISSEGEPVLHRRKLKATGQERTIWGDAPGLFYPTRLKSAVKGPGGVTIGSLCCWEHLQPLLRFHHYSLGVQVHVASWPYCDYCCRWAHRLRFSSDAQIVQSKFAALEGHMFVISSTQILSRENADFVGAVKGAGAWEMPMGGGFAAIYAPDGTQITPTIPPIKRLSFTRTLIWMRYGGRNLFADPVGHYSRPDLLSLNPRGTRDHALLGRIV
ncbi:carbon-nitrogen hydrolase [Mycena olivaceomarginata]|nr:carbon-nitrogen hydrolase [Mycena olivaceomarginata]